MLKNYVVLILFVLTSATLFGQDEYQIQDEGSHEFSCFDDSLIVTAGGSYGPNETYEITFCLPGGTEGNVEVVISPALFGDLWDVDGNSFLSVHNGGSSAAPLIGGGMFNSVNDPEGIIVTTNGSSCITLVFASGNGSSGAGFTAHIRCEVAFQPFFVDLTAQPEFQPTNVDSLSIAVCFADSFSVSVTTSYPLSDASGNGYEQSDATSQFNWAMGDGNNLTGFGLTEITYAYASGSGHEINLSIIDASGTIQHYRFYVLQSPRPDFSNVALEDTLCIGSETVISGGINLLTQDTVGIGPGTGAILGGGSVGGQETVFDANPPDCDVYSIPLEINEFEDGQTLDNIDDLLNICVNMYHTYLGDLEMGLICPGAQDTLVLFDMRNTGGTCPNLFPGGADGGGTALGEPGATPTPIGYDYCFNNSPDNGTFEDVNATLAGTDPMPAGTYTTMSDINSLIGCPLNGEWQLIILDGYLLDVGVINSWSLFFNPDINPSTQYYSPEIVSAGWDDNSDLVVNDDSTSVTVTPSQEGNNAFTFFAYDEFGCRHDTTIEIYVRPYVEFPDAIACDLTHIASPANAPNGGTYTTLTTPTPTASLDFVPIVEGFSPDSIFANEYGIYDIDFTENNCQYSDTASIDFRPVPQIQAFIDSTVLCIGEELTLDAGPQEANSGNFSIVWTQDGNTFNTSDYAVTIDETGYYALTITGACGSATDATDLVAIKLSFDGDTVCGLQASGAASLSPTGSGLWTSNSGDISFSSANQLNTQISSSKYGGYPITFTDSRCPEDGVTHNFRFVEQPEVNINPQYPDFCIDTDSLVLVASVNGSNKGTYIWSVNGNPDTDDDNVLEFGPNPDPMANPDGFLPLEDYLIEVLVQDAFGVCPIATGAANFTGKWCNYTIPNVVTPNGDGKNDKFNVQYIEYFPHTRLRVYDRWGKLVFEQADYDQYQQSKGGWDPSDLTSGTYFYELLVPQVDKMETGNVEILKDGSGK